MCWAASYPSIQFKPHFSKQQLTGGSGGRMSDRYCRCIPPPASPFLHQWTDIGQSNWREVLLGIRLLNTPDREVLRIQGQGIWWPICQSPEFSQHLLGGPGCSWWCGPALNLPKDVFSPRIPPLDLKDLMLSQKLLVNVGINMLAGRNQPWAA